MRRDKDMKGNNSTGPFRTKKYKPWCFFRTYYSFNACFQEEFTFSLFSFLLTMTALICWSMKMRMVTSRAGTKLARYTHHGFFPNGITIQPRSGRVGYRTRSQTNIHCTILRLIAKLTAVIAAIKISPVLLTIIFTKLFF